MHDGNIKIFDLILIKSQYAIRLSDCLINCSQDKKESINDTYTPHQNVTCSHHDIVEILFTWG